MLLLRRPCEISKMRWLRSASRHNHYGVLHIVHESVGSVCCSIALKPQALRQEHQELLQRARDARGREALGKLSEWLSAFVLKKNHTYADYRPAGDRTRRKYAQAAEINGGSENEAKSDDKRTSSSDSCSSVAGPKTSAKKRKATNGKLQRTRHEQLCLQQSYCSSGFFNT